MGTKSKIIAIMITMETVVIAAEIGFLIYINSSMAKMNRQLELVRLEVHTAESGQQNQVDDDAWKQAYLDYIQQKHSEYCAQNGNDWDGDRYALIDVNHDTIPELMIDEDALDASSGGVFLATYSNGIVCDSTSDTEYLSFLSYIEKENLCLFYHAMGGYNEIEIRGIEDGRYVLIASGSIEPGYDETADQQSDDTYCWNGIQMADYGQFDSALNQVYDESKAIRSDQIVQYTAEEMQAVIANETYPEDEQKTPWKQAYADYIHQHAGNIYTLFYMDQDDIPELFAWNIEKMYGNIVTADNTTGEYCESEPFLLVGTNYSVYYLEYQNFVDISQYGMGSMEIPALRTSEIYSIVNGRACQVDWLDYQATNIYGDGSYDNLIDTIENYYRGSFENEITEEEYYARLHEGEVRELDFQNGAAAGQMLDGVLAPY